MEGLPASGGSGCGESGDLRLGEIDGWKGRASVDDIPTSGTGSRQDWEAGLLESGDIPLDRADADVECLGEPLSGAPVRASTTQFLAYGEKPIGAIHR